MDVKPTPPVIDIEKSADLLDAMSNAIRLNILRVLVQSEMSVGELCELVGLNHQALAHHLAKLRAKHLVETRRDAQTVYYSSRSLKVMRVLASLAETTEPD